MDRIVLYHGSSQVVDKPIFGRKSTNNDYGDAFYCTQDLFAAKEWANKRISGGFANKYNFDGRGLKILDLRDKNQYSVLHWFSILMHYRTLDPTFKDAYKRELDYLEKHYFIDVSQYDVVIGYRADDSFFEFPIMFIEGRIRLERLESIYNLGYLGEQIAIVSRKAFERLSFVKAIKAEPIYKEKYDMRITIADNRFKEIVNEERFLKGTRLQDMVMEDGNR